METFLNSPVCTDVFAAELVGRGGGAMTRGWGLYCASSLPAACSGPWSWRSGAWSCLETPEGWCAAALDRCGETVILPPVASRDLALMQASAWNGYSYRVEIAADDSDFVDFDAALGNQPRAYEAFAQAYRSHYRRPAPASLPRLSGFGALLMLSGGASGMASFETESRRTSEQLAAVGLAGVRFVAGDGVVRHAVFDLARISLLERNGESVSPPRPIPPARSQRLRLALAA